MCGVGRVCGGLVWVDGEGGVGGCGEMRRVFQLDNFHFQETLAKLSVKH